MRCEFAIKDIADINVWKIVIILFLASFYETCMCCYDDYEYLKG